MKFIISILIGSMIAFAAAAKDPHHSHYEPVPEVYNYYTNTTVIETDGVATSIAMGQHQFDLGTFKWQGSVAVGAYGSNEALSIALGKRLCDSCGLLNIAIARGEEHTGYGAAYNFKF